MMTCREWDKGFIAARENSCENEHFQEMVVLRKKRSGLPANLFLDDEGSWINSGHWKRIMFQPNRDDRAVSANLVPMSIEDNPRILVENARIDLNSRELEQIKTFTGNNKDLLLQLGDQAIDIGEFLEKMKLEKHQA